MKTDDELLAEASALDEAYASAELGDAEAVERDIRALVAAAREVVATRGMVRQKLNCLEAALDAFEPWLEPEETPQQMGWVDDRGRP